VGSAFGPRWLSAESAGKLGSVDAEDRYYRVEEHPTTVVVRGVLYSLWVALGVPVLCSGVLGADSFRVAAGLLLVGQGLPLGPGRGPPHGSGSEMVGGARALGVARLCP
jgi:hypothetical protein